MRPTNFDIHDLISDLQGTCATIDDHLPEGMEWDDLTTDDHNIIDNEIFLCTECGWWCEISEHTSQDVDEPFCQDCKPDDE